MRKELKSTESQKMHTVFIYLHQVTIVFIHIEKADIQSKKVQLLNETKL